MPPPKFRGDSPPLNLSRFFQPIVDLSDLSLVGFEALARWRRPDRGVVEPAEFVNIAEANGLIRAIDSVILDRAWQVLEDALSACPLSGPPLMLSVNMSAVNLLDAAIVDRVAALIENGRGDTPHLQFEITETLLIKDKEGAEQILDRLKAMGVTFALDDFGTGYSSLVYLHRLPIDCIKIDRSFFGGDCIRSAVPQSRTFDYRVGAIDGTAGGRGRGQREGSRGCLESAGLSLWAGALFFGTHSGGRLGRPAATSPRRPRLRYVPLILQPRQDRVDVARVVAEVEQRIEMFGC